MNYRILAAADFAHAVDACGAGADFYSRWVLTDKRARPPARRVVYRAVHNGRPPAAAFEFFDLVAADPARYELRSQLLGFRDPPAPRSAGLEDDFGVDDDDPGFGDFCEA
jgi:hypothetical protein